MDRTAIAERVERIDAVCSDLEAEAPAIEAALVAARELTGWVEARRGVLVGKLVERSSFPEAAIAAVDRTSIAVAQKARERAETLDATPRLAEVLGEGATTAGHIDAVTRAARKLPEARRGELLDRADALANVAAVSTVEQFAKRVALEAQRIESGDGMDRLERQRRATRLRSGVDDEGMWNVRGRFDAVTGVRLDAKLHATVEALFSESTPQGCPDDAIEKQQFLAAHALTRLLDGAGSSKPGRAEYLVVIDADATDQPGPVAQWPIPVEIPTRVLAELAGDADVSTVVVRNGVVLYAPGELNLGRSTRLANRAQRRALRGLYRCCAIPGCNVGYDRCELHHLVWWRNGGRTDIDNLIPICTRHHGRVHHDGWVVELGPDRQLTLRLPDGTIRSTGPPTIRAA
ncbi:MAG: HNH endonuclease [Acidimicrobiales bacterium]|nr:MAG: HNH endonuclease [Acidimicrobiales bacterium]